MEHGDWCNALHVLVGCKNARNDVRPTHVLKFAEYSAASRATPPPVLENVLEACFEGVVPASEDSFVALVKALARSGDIRAAIRGSSLAVRAFEGCEGRVITQRDRHTSDDTSKDSHVLRRNEKAPLYDFAAHKRKTALSSLSGTTAKEGEKDQINMESGTATKPSVLSFSARRGMLKSILEATAKSGDMAAASQAAALLAPTIVKSDQELSSLLQETRAKSGVWQDAVQLRVPSQRTSSTGEGVALPTERFSRLDLARVGISAARGGNWVVALQCVDAYDRRATEELGGLRSEDVAREIGRHVPALYGSALAAVAETGLWAEALRVGRKWTDRTGTVSEYQADLMFGLLPLAQPAPTTTTAIPSSSDVLSAHVVNVFRQMSVDATSFAMPALACAVVAGHHLRVGRWSVACSLLSRIANDVASRPPTVDALARFHDAMDVAASVGAAVLPAAAQPWFREHFRRLEAPVAGELGDVDASCDTGTTGFETMADLAPHRPPHVRPARNAYFGTAAAPDIPMSLVAKAELIGREKARREWADPSRDPHEDPAPEPTRRYVPDGDWNPRDSDLRNDLEQPKFMVNEPKGWRGAKPGEVRVAAYRKGTSV
jgi:hypothetical protein